MKVRFHSAKERAPTEDSGLKVLYAPSKRTAFKVRWYLVLTLMILPAAWLVSSYGLDLLRIEAPALVKVPTVDIRARQAGQVKNLLVQVGDHVEVNSPLVTLSNPEWELRLALLQTPTSSVTPSAPLGSIDQRYRGVLQSLIDRAQQRMRATRALVANGAATRGELLDAQNALDNRRAELLAFERNQAGGGVTASVIQDNRLAQQQAAERQWLQAQLANLQITAQERGRVAEVLVNEGENVGPGTLLLRVEQAGPAQLWIYLDPKDVEHSTPGTALEVRLPDGDWREAVVMSAAESANPLPTDLRKPFSSPTRGLLVPARFTSPLPEAWRVDSLPVQVRFTPQHFQWLGSHF